MTVERPTTVIDRERVWRTLERVWNSDRAELAIVIGRRRVGKSFVLAPFCRAVGGLYYQATRRTEAEQLRVVSRLAGERFNDAALLHGGGLPDWESLFRYLVQRAAGAPLLVVLDEFPYLEVAARALPSVFQSLWDHDLQGTRLKVVLCGSHITSMTRLEAADQPLYARRTARIDVAPFTFRDVARFVPSYAPRDQLLTYGVFGGLPGHLALLDPALDLPRNVASQVLNPTARLFDEAQHMLDAFLGSAEVHYSILEAIAGGQETWSGITSRVGKTSGSLSRPMKWLIDMQLVRRVVPFTETRPGRSKRALYRIADPYVRFWHRFVASLIQTGVSGSLAPDELYRARVEPALDAFMGPLFEEVCRRWVRSGRSPFPAFRVGEWWRKDAQIDVVATSGAGDVMVGECKWGTVGRSDLAALRARVGPLVAELERAGAVQLALFSGRGLADDDVREAVASGRVQHFGLDDLFA